MADIIERQIVAYVDQAFPTVIEKKLNETNLSSLIKTLIGIETNTPSDKEKRKQLIDKIHLRLQQQTFTFEIPIKTNGTIIQTPVDLALTYKEYSIILYYQIAGELFTFYLNDYKITISKLEGTKITEEKYIPDKPNIGRILNILFSLYVFTGAVLLKFHNRLSIIWDDDGARILDLDNQKSRLNNAIFEYIKEIKNKSPTYQLSEDDISIFGKYPAQNILSKFLTPKRYKTLVATSSDNQVISAIASHPKGDSLVDLIVANKIYLSKELTDHLPCNHKRLYNMISKKVADVLGKREEKKIFPYELNSYEHMIKFNDNITIDLDRFNFEGKYYSGFKLHFRYNIYYDNTGGEIENSIDFSLMLEIPNLEQESSTTPEPVIIMYYKKEKAIEDYRETVGSEKNIYIRDEDSLSAFILYGTLLNMFLDVLLSALTGIQTLDIKQVDKNSDPLLKVFRISDEPNDSTMINDAKKFFKETTLSEYLNTQDLCKHLNKYMISILRLGQEYERYSLNDQGKIKNETLLSEIYSPMTRIITENYVKILNFFADDDIQLGGKRKKQS